MWCPGVGVLIIGSQTPLHCGHVRATPAVRVLLPAASWALQFHSIDLVMRMKVRISQGHFSSSTQFEHRNTAYLAFMSVRSLQYMILSVSRTFLLLHLRKSKPIINVLDKNIRESLQ